MKRFHFVLLLLTVTSASAAQSVPPLDLKDLSPDQFSDEEIDLPYYLAHFHTLANSVVMSGPDRGFIDLPIWRGSDQQHTYNARVMENVLSLAFFYSTNRFWNPYYGNQEVRERLEAALQYWVDLQLETGFFSETDEGLSEISPTGFAIKFIGETLRVLHAGPPLDADLLDDVVEAAGRAIEAFLASEEFFEHGTRYSNHYTTVWGGALAYLDLYPNAELSDLLRKRIRQGLEVFQSPAGFFYERRGPDWVYEIETHHSNHLLAWHYLHDTELGISYAAAIERWYDWLAFNSVLEPDTSGFVMNQSIATRRTFSFYEENRIAGFGRTCLPVAEVVVLARAFCESREERAARLSEVRTQLEKSWPSLPDLAVGEFYGYSPYAFLHRNHVSWHPTSAQKQHARRQLPVFRSGDVLHHRGDDRSEIDVAFIRRAPYYAIFNVGVQTDEHQQFGLGLVWTAREGAVLQTQKIDQMAWGTLTPGMDETYEAEIPGARFEVAGRPLELEPGSRDVESATISVEYALGERGRKQVSFEPDRISVSIQHAGPIVEQIPLLVPQSQEPQFYPGRIRLGSQLLVSFNESATATSLTPSRKVGNKRVTVLELRTVGNLEYELQF